MPWMTSMLAALALSQLSDVSCIGGGNRFASYEELNAAPLLERSALTSKRCSRFLGVRECQEQVTGAPADAVDVDAELNQGTSKMLNALFGLTQSTPATLRPTEAALSPYQLPPMYYNDFFEDLLTSKRNDARATGCDCKVTNDLVDLGSTYFPRYLMSAICKPRQDAKCRQGSNCKPLEYKVKVLTLGKDQVPFNAADAGSASSPRLWVPDEVSQLWQWHFETVTVTAGCFCTN